MAMTMGQIIRKLRKERGLTQEELAEQLNMTAQAISRWENETGLPDIAQIVPLASVFGVSTDVLFGIEGTNLTEAAYRIVGEAEAIKVYGERDTYLAAYDRMLDGLKAYPNNLILLNNCVGLGLSLCLPENGWLYSAERADEIAAETERQAKLITTYAKHATDIMRAHQVLLLLYTSRGKFEQAYAEAETFPVRTDFTLYANMARVDDAKGDYASVIEHLRIDNAYALQAFADSAARLGKAYCASGRYGEAIEVYEGWFRVMKALFGENFPPYHDFDSGDGYILLAQAYLAAGDRNNAMQNVEHAVMYDLDRFSLDNLNETDSPFVEQGMTSVDLTSASVKKRLTEKLASAELAPLRDLERFQVLCSKVSAL